MHVDKDSGLSVEITPIFFIFKTVFNLTDTSDIDRNVTAEEVDDGIFNLVNGFVFANVLKTVSFSGSQFSRQARFELTQRFDPQDLELRARAALIFFCQLRL